MRKVILEPSLRKALDKLYIKDWMTHDAILEKMEEVCSCGDLSHYKNLRAPLQRLKRVHIRKSFVLTFREEDDAVRFFDFDHHDRIYEKR